MNNVISRQAAIEAMGEEPLVWDELTDEWELAQREMWRRHIKALKSLPAAQPEIVRCKDCKHRDAESGFCEGRGWPMQLVPDDGFCDKGKGAKNDLQSMGMSRSGI